MLVIITHLSKRGTSNPQIMTNGTNLMTLKSRRQALIKSKRSALEVNSKRIRTTSSKMRVRLNKIECLRDAAALIWCSTKELINLKKSHLII